MACKKHGYTKNVFCPACDLEEIEDHKLRKTVETSQMFLSRAAMDALTRVAQTIGGLDGVAIIDILDRCTVVESGTIKNSVLVDRGALCMALNVLRRADKTEIADALESACSTPPAAASAEAQTFGTFGHIGVDKSPLTHAAARASTSPALRGVTDEDVRIAGKAYDKTGNKPTVGTHEEGIRAALESFRVRLSTAQGVDDGLSGCYSRLTSK